MRLRIGGNGLALCVAFHATHLRVFSFVFNVEQHYFTGIAAVRNSPPSPNPVACEPKVFRILSPGIPQAPWLDDRLPEPPSLRAASETRSPAPNTLK